MHFWSTLSDHKIKKLSVWRSQSMRKCWLSQSHYQLTLLFFFSHWWLIHCFCHASLCHFIVFTVGSCRSSHTCAAWWHIESWQHFMCCHIRKRGKKPTRLHEQWKKQMQSIAAEGVFKEPDTYWIWLQAGKLRNFKKKRYFTKWCTIPLNVTRYSRKKCPITLGLEKS